MKSNGSNIYNNRDSQTLTKISFLNENRSSKIVNISY